MNVYIRVAQTVTVTILLLEAELTAENVHWPWEIEALKYLTKI